MGWQDTKIVDTGKYFKVKPGEIKICHILNKEPEYGFIHWVNNKKEICNGNACALCQEGHKKLQRWNTDVIDRGDGKKKEFQFGPEIAGQIRDIAAMLVMQKKTIQDIDLMIKATQLENRVTYKVMNVDKPNEGNDQPPEEEPSPDSEDEVPF